MLRHLDRTQTVLVLPLNDAEAVQIFDIAKAIGIEIIISDQPHGARLEHEKDLLKKMQARKKQTMVVVEIPGPRMEEHLKKAGLTVWWIDHHRYDDVNRMTDPETGEALPSSLEQTLIAFDITDEELTAHGFDPRLVRGVGAMDRGFLWALERDGYTEDERKQVSRYVRSLSQRVRGDDRMKQNDEAAERAWTNRRQDGEFLIVTSDEPKAEIRPTVSLMAAEAFGKPTPMIIASRSELLLYVQETSKALLLFKTFGGFTFGQDTCWGFNNATAKKKVSLEQVLDLLRSDTIEKV